MRRSPQKSSILPDCPPNSCVADCFRLVDNVCSLHVRSVCGSPEKLSNVTKRSALLQRSHLWDPMLGHQQSPRNSRVDQRIQVTSQVKKGREFDDLLSAAVGAPLFRRFFSIAFLLGRVSTGRTMIQDMRFLGFQRLLALAFMFFAGQKHCFPMAYGFWTTRIGLSRSLPFFWWSNHVKP